MRTPSYIIINNGKATTGPASSVNLFEAETPEDWYRYRSFNYPKFFKMDILSKWAWLGAEMLLQDEKGLRYENQNKERIGVMLATGSGCIDVDRRYRTSMNSIPSPALFVYTLPNIMLGEICIRHGFKGEQLCIVQEQFNASSLQLWAADGLRNRGLDACLCGWVNTADDSGNLALFWLTKEDADISAETMQMIYNQHSPVVS